MYVFFILFYCCVYFFFFFFFQAEDGIRDLTVTGVQTCALPIFGNVDLTAVNDPHDLHEVDFCVIPAERSEERRVGKSVDLGGRRIIKKKKKKIRKKT